MNRPILIDKPLGATPLQALTQFRHARGVAESVKLAYAGRLDPLASGLIPILSGDQLMRQEDYWYLPKRYRATVLLGIRTDSYDLLGIPSPGPQSAVAPERITVAVRGLVGKLDLSVPVYSSQRHEGRPLFLWAREQGESVLSVPVRRMTVAQIDVHQIDCIESDALREIVEERIALVHGDFRQQDILAMWQRVLAVPQEFTSVQFEVRCASGTYIRSLAHEIGRRLGTGAVLSDLRRTHVGPWTVDDDDVIRLAWPR